MHSAWPRGQRDDVEAIVRRRGATGGRAAAAVEPGKAELEKEAPRTVAAAGQLVFVATYGSGHVRSSDLTNDPGNTLSLVGLDDRQH